MLQASASIVINLIFTVLIGQFEEYSSSARMILGSFAATGVIFSLAGLTSYLSTKRKSSYFIAQAGFILFFPMGLIGVFGMRKLRQKIEKGDTVLLPSSLVNPVLIGGVVMAVALVVSAHQAQSIFFSSRNLEQIIRHLPLTILYAFGILLLARQDLLDFSVPGFALATSILFLQGLAEGSFSRFMLFALTFGLVLFVPFLYSLFKCLSGVPSSTVSFLGLIASWGLSLTLSRGTMIRVEPESIFKFPASGLVLVLAGGALILILMKLSSRKFESYSSGKSRGFILTWTAFAAAIVLGLLRGLYFGKYLGGIRPTLPVADVVFILFAFLFLRAFKAATLSRFGLLLALIPSVLWGMMDNLMSLGGVTVDWQYLIKAFPILLLGILSYYIKGNSHNPVPGRSSV